MIENFDFEIITGSLPFLLKGLKVSFYLTFLALIGGIFFGTLLALMRVSKFKTLQYFSMTYVNFLRSLPLILVIFWSSEKVVAVKVSAFLFHSTSYL